MPSGRSASGRHSQSKCAYTGHSGQPGDIVVLAGKGHETYQEIEGKKYHMSEEEIVQDVLDGKY